MKLRNMKEISCILGSTVVLSALVLGGCGKQEQRNETVTVDETTVADEEITTLPETESGGESTAAEGASGQGASETTGGASAKTEAAITAESTTLKTGIEKDSLTANAQSTAKTAQAPEVTTATQSGAAQEPTVAMQAPTTKTQCEVAQEPTVATTQAATTTKAPMATTQAATTTKKPTATTQAVTTTKKPTATTQAATTTKKPTATTQAATTTKSPTTGSDLKSVADSNAVTYRAYYEEVLRLVNAIRAEVGVGPLVLDDTLCRAASMRAVEMDYNNVFSHTRPDGSSCFTVYQDYGITYFTTGENIAAGYQSPAAVVEGWKNSPGHYANMIKAEFGKLGVGYSKAGIGSYGNYWVQMFTD